MSYYMPHYKHHVISHAYCPTDYQKRSHHPPNPLHMAVFYECVCGGQGEGSPTAWLNASSQQSYSNRSWLPNCTNKRRS